MKRNTLFTMLFMAVVAGSALLTSSCSESEDPSEFDNWQARNDHFIDSIAHVADLNADGSWERIKAFNIGEETSLYLGQNKYFIYVKRLETGSGTYSPLYTDSVRVHYSGRLIPSKSYSAGYQFDKSYDGSAWVESTDVPSLMGVNGVVTGFATALMYMKEGDRWLVYVPYYLGYGTKDYTKAQIPGYSTLVFDVKLARIYRYKIDTDTSWH